VDSVTRKRIDAIVAAGKARLYSPGPPVKNHSTAPAGYDEQRDRYTFGVRRTAFRASRTR
jgi:hypothetical protein